MLRRAVERNIGTIGEAVNRVLRDTPEIKITNTRAIIATRNRVIHDYTAVTDDVIWKIVINDLPKLREEVSKLLEGEELPSTSPQPLIERLPEPIWSGGRFGFSFWSDYRAQQQGRIYYHF